jgi:hypothetical protein
MDIMFNKFKFKFKIYLNNNEILKTKWEHDKKKKRLNVTSSVQERGAQVNNVL